MKPAEIINRQNLRLLMQNYAARINMDMRTWPLAYWLWTIFIALSLTGGILTLLTPLDTHAGSNGSLNTAALKAYLQKSGFSEGRHPASVQGAYGSQHLLVRSFHKDLDSHALEISIGRDRVIILLLDPKNPYPDYAPLTPDIDLRRTAAAIELLQSIADPGRIIGLLCNQKVNLEDVLQRQREKLRAIKAGEAKISKWEHVWKKPYEIRTESGFLPLAMGIYTY